MDLLKSEYVHHVEMEKSKNPELDYVFKSKEEKDELYKNNLIEHVSKTHADALIKLIEISRTY